MKKKIKCEVEGYEDIMFEVGQHWKTRDNVIVEITSVFDDSILSYPIETKSMSYTRDGKEFKHRKSENDLITLIVAEVDEIVKPAEEPVEECLEPVETYKDNEDLWEFTDCNKIKVVEENHKLMPIGIAETSAEDKMVEILHQLLRQRHRDLEKISLVFNTFIEMEKMK